jgi:2'-5' RNA ligase
MTPAASLDGNGRLRLFFALPIPAAAAEGLASWAARNLGGGEGVRPVAASQLHVTLAFLGGRPASDLDLLRHALQQVSRDAELPRLTVERYRETPSVCMLVLDDHNGWAATLQARLSAALVSAGLYEPERRPWLAHLTVARIRRRPSAKVALPTIRPISPSEAALYHSTLRPSGAQYDIIEAVPLGG